MKSVGTFLICTICLAGGLAALGVVAFLCFAYSAAHPDNYSRGYQPGSVNYEAREFWLSLPEVASGGEWTCDWSVLLPFTEEEESP